jgi:hypothetical protein
MTTTAKPTTEVAAYWREARKLYTVYSSLLERFALGLLPCRELESPIDRSEPDSVQNIQRWFEQMDGRVHVHQLRQLLQTSRLGTEDNLRSLVNHHLQKDTKTESDRDKVDFLFRVASSDWEQLADGLWSVNPRFCKRSSGEQRR